MMTTFWLDSHPPLIVELRVVTLGYQHLTGKVALADSWSAPNPDSAHICLVDEFEILAVNALQIAQVLNLNFGGNFLELTLAATNRIARFGSAPP